MKPIFIQTIPIALLLMILQGCSTSTSHPLTEGKTPSPVKTPQMAKVGFIAPDFKLKKVTGESIALNTLRGKIVLVNFWATWCEPCRAEMPSMEEIYRDFNRKDFEILAVSSDEDGLTSVKPFLDEFPFTFPILIDDSLLINDLYGVSSIPTSIVIDRSGMITNRFFGAVDWSEPKQKKFLTQLIQSPA